MKIVSARKDVEEFKPCNGERRETLKRKGDQKERTETFYKGNSQKDVLSCQKKTGMRGEDGRMKKSGLLEENGGDGGHRAQHNNE